MVESFEMEKVGIIGKLTIMRHGETNYSDKFPDLTDIGIEQAKLVGKSIKIEDGEEPLFVSSPRARARGTLSVAMGEIGINLKDQSIRQSSKIRSVDIANWENAMEYFSGVQGTTDRSQWRIKLMDKAFADGGFPEDVFGKRSDIEKRIADGFEIMIKFFQKYSDKQKIFHVVAVSHFEVMNVFAEILFADLLKEDTYNLAEKMEIKFENMGNKKVRLICNFRNQERSVVFDRKTRNFLVE